MRLPKELAVAFFAALALSLSADHGISPERLVRVGAVLQRAVDSRSVGSAVGLVARSGRIVFVGAVGEVAPGVPMTDDAIVRLASITKPITAVAVLILYEEGKVRLSDSVDRYLPEFTNAASERPITIYDLLTHQAGLQADGPELDKIWDEAKTTSDFSSRLARLPLRFPPGSQYEYGPAYEVLTAIIEKVTGQTYERFLSERVLRPLKMFDTFFFVPKEKQARLAAQYRRDTSGALVPFRARGQEGIPGEFYSGGGGLRSTVRDYFRFAQFLLNGGQLDGVRLLSPLTVRLMTADHVGGKYPDPNYGWGLGVQVRRTAAGSDIGSVGSYGWNGGTGTLFVVDPRERLIVILFAPTTPRTAGVSELRKDFVAAAYQSIAESYDR